MEAKQTVAVIGVGTMGKALARGLRRLDGIGLRGACRLVDQAGPLSEEVGFPVTADAAAAIYGSETVLLCVKPHRVQPVVEDLVQRGALDHRPLLVSIAAGVATRSIERASGARARVVRAMPNTPALIGEGMTVVARGTTASAEDAERAAELFRPLGRVLTLDEEHMDACTGLSGSGPAFVYVIVEALAEGGVMAGLPRKVATELAAQTVLGAARMVLETGRHPAALKDEVTTPAGCTISALLSMEDGRLRSVLARGVQEAARTAGGLG